jgi:hypothetical protein
VENKIGIAEIVFCYSCYPLQSFSLYQKGCRTRILTVIAATFLAMYFCEIECRLANRNVLTFAVKWVRILNASVLLYFYGMPCFRMTTSSSMINCFFLLWYKCIHQIQEFDRFTPLWRCNHMGNWNRRVLGWNKSVVSINLPSVVGTIKGCFVWYIFHFILFTLIIPSIFAALVIRLGLQFGFFFFAALTANDQKKFIWYKVL